MVFLPPPHLPALPFDPPDSIPICDFMLDEAYGRHAHATALAPYTCGLTGKEYASGEMRERVDQLARGLAKELGFAPDRGTEWDRVVGVFSVNAIDLMTLSWALHRLGAISSPANAAYSLDELVHQLRSSRAQALFTCAPLLPTALAAAAAAGIPEHRIYLLDLPPAAMLGGKPAPQAFKTVDDLIAEGATLPALAPLRWEKGQGARQTAFLCYSSGTSGLPKGVMISHRNVIANTLQLSAFEKPHRDRLTAAAGPGRDYLDVGLGLLPMSHIYSLIVVCHASTYRGDRVVVLPRFEMESYCEAIQRFGINTLYLVPPIVIAMNKNKPLVDRYDFSAVKQLYTGAAPLGPETSDAFSALYPDIAVRQAYGMTESSTVTTMTAHDDILPGSSGTLIPGVEARLVGVDGDEITGHEQRGELLVRSPSVVLGYLNNAPATRETFQGGWLRTGDEALVRKSARGTEHIVVVDRIKELIKVNGLQVAPAELEAHLLTHRFVADAAVIPVPDDRAGEVPKAFVVKSKEVGIEDNERLVGREIAKHVEKAKAKHKWLRGGVELVDEIPKSPSGKILRRVLRERERERGKGKGKVKAKL